MSVDYIKFDEAGRILQRGRTSAATLAARIAAGERLLQSDAHPDDHKVVDGRVVALTHEDHRARAAADRQTEAARVEALPLSDRRAAEYPPLTDFADAFYWASKGDNAPMERWLAACDAVKAKHPKG